MIDAIITILIWILTITGLSIVGYIVFDELKYKHRALIKVRTKYGRQNKIKRAKPIVDKDGSHWWKVKGYKTPIPQPTAEYLELTDKGNFLATFFELDGGELHPVRLDDKEMDEESKEFVMHVKPLKTSQRQTIVNQQLKIQRQHKKSLADVAMYAVPFIAVVVILSIIMIFADEAMQPMIELGKTNEIVTEKLSLVADKLDTVINNRVHITDIETSSGVYNLTPPN